MNSQLLRILLFLGTIFIWIHAKDIDVLRSKSALSSAQHVGMEICETTKLSTEKLYVDCADKDLSTFPDIPNKDAIQVFNFSNNAAPVLGYPWSNFTNLEELIIRSANLEKMAADSLLVLHKLHTLDMSFSSANLKYLKIPPSIKRFYFDSKSGLPSSGIVLNLSNLPNLMELTFKHQSLSVFPKLNIICPIVYVDLTGNPLQKFKYQDIAPFCSLDTLILSSSSVIFSKSCCGIRKWLDTYEISSELKCFISCSNITLDNESKQMYRECKIRTGSFQLDAIPHLLEIFVIVGLIAATMYLVYKYYTARAVVLEKLQSHDDELEENSQEVDEQYMVK